MKFCLTHFDISIILQILLKVGGTATWLSDVDFVLPKPGRWPNSVGELHLNGMQDWETQRASFKGKHATQPWGVWSSTGSAAAVKNQFSGD